MLIGSFATLNGLILAMGSSEKLQLENFINKHHPLYVKLLQALCQKYRLTDSVPARNLLTDVEIQDCKDSCGKGGVSCSTAILAMYKSFRSFHSLVPHLDHHLAIAPTDMMKEMQENFNRLTLDYDELERKYNRSVDKYKDLKDSSKGIYEVINKLTGQVENKDKALREMHRILLENSIDIPHDLARAFPDPKSTPSSSSVSFSDVISVLEITPRRGNAMKKE